MRERQKHFMVGNLPGLLGYEGLQWKKPNHSLSGKSQQKCSASISNAIAELFYDTGAHKKGTVDRPTVEKKSYNNDEFMNEILRIQ